MQFTVLLALFIYLVQLSLSQSDEGYPCNVVEISWVNYKPLGVCLAESVSGEESSSTYVCNEDKTAVEFRVYANTECSGDPELDPDVITTDTSKFECDKTGCPILEYKEYDAELVQTDSGDTCSPTDDFIEDIFAVNFCFLGVKPVCTMTSYNTEIYWEGDSDWEILADIANVWADDWELKSNCTTSVASTRTLATAGCNDANTKYYEIVACSACYQYHVMLLYVMVFLVYVSFM